jgi:hypothetical protein
VSLLNAVLAVCAVALWVGTFAWYFREDLARFLREQADRWFGS